MRKVEITLIRNYYKGVTITREVDEKLSDYEIEQLFEDDLDNALSEASFFSDGEDEIEIN